MSARAMTLIRRAAQSIFALADGLRSPLAGPRVLIYHQVGSDRHHEMNVELDVFRRQIAWMEEQGEIVDLEEAISRSGEPDAERLFVITFDDGYSDLYENAFPLLEERNHPFTVYLTTGPIESPESFSTWPGRPLTWQKVRTMQESGLMTVGAHTHTHPDLREVDASSAGLEIDVSNRLIEERSGETPLHFTYPKGWWAESADAVVRRTYATATVGMGSSISPNADRHTLGRVSVIRSDGFATFTRKMRSGGSTEARLRRVRHRYHGP